MYNFPLLPLGLDILNLLCSNAIKVIIYFRISYVLWWLNNTLKPTTNSCFSGARASLNHENILLLAEAGVHRRRTLIAELTTASADHVIAAFVSAPVSDEAFSRRNDILCFTVIWFTFRWQHCRPDKTCSFPSKTAIPCRQLFQFSGQRTIAISAQSI